MSAVLFVKHRPVFTNILVALDDSAPAGWALQLAIRIAKDTKATISVIHVITSPRHALDPLEDEAILKLVVKDNPVFRNALAQVPGDLLGDLILREGEPAPEIVQAAKDIHADLLVIGTHERSDLGRFPLGSTADAIVGRAPCPVLTVSQPLESESIASTEVPAPYELVNTSTY